VRGREREGRSEGRWRGYTSKEEVGRGEGRGREKKRDKEGEKVPEYTTPIKTLT
jgi:hypothetical protein